MVFAPTPQLTVTVDQPNDHPELHLHPGGQGVWQARMVISLGVDVVLCAALGGEIGQVLEPLLVSEGVDLKVVVRRLRQRRVRARPPGAAPGRRSPTCPVSR